MTPQIYKTRDVLKNWGSVLAGFEKYLLYLKASCFSFVFIVPDYFYNFFKLSNNTLSLIFQKVKCQVFLNPKSSKSKK